MNNNEETIVTTLTRSHSFLGAFETHKEFLPAGTEVTIRRNRYNTAWMVKPTGRTIYRSEKIMDHYAATYLGHIA